MVQDKARNQFYTYRKQGGRQGHGESGSKGMMSLTNQPVYAYILCFASDRMECDVLCTCCELRLITDGGDRSKRRLIYLLLALLPSI
jgi:hypothetical protein